MLREVPDQSRIINGQRLSGWRLYIYDKFGGAWIKRRQPGAQFLSLRLVGRLCGNGGITKPRPILQHFVSIPRCEERRSRRRSRIDEAVHAVAVDAAKA